MKLLKKKKISKKELIYDSYLTTLHQIEAVAKWLDDEENFCRPENMRRFYEGRFEALLQKIITLAKMMKLKKESMKTLEGFILKCEKIKERKRSEIDEFFE